MQASRISTRALKHLTTTTKQTRSLHMTGPATFSNLITSERPKYNHPRVSSETDSRLPDTSEPGKSTRQFNTSRSLKAVNDSSTIDFAYIPDFDPDSKTAPVVRVPILPQTIASQASRLHIANDVEEPIIIPTLFTVSHDNSHIHAPSALSVDGGSINFQGITSHISSTLAKPLEEGSMVRHIWNGLVEDILGPSTKAQRT